MYVFIEEKIPPILLFVWYPPRNNDVQSLLGELSMFSIGMYGIYSDPEGHIDST